MRMNPVNGETLWREVFRGGAVINGHHVSAGVDCGKGIYRIHHQADYFPQPYKCLPERWILSGSNSEAAAEMGQSIWAPFSMGPRGCVGKTVAIMQLSISLATISFLYGMRTPAEQALARIGQGDDGERFPRNLNFKYQAKGFFSAFCMDLREFRSSEVSKVYGGLI
jgi:cytochrome P450